MPGSEEDENGDCKHKVRHRRVEHPRNSLEFSWINSEFQLDSIFDMVSEAPLEFILQDIFTYNLSQLLDVYDESSDCSLLPIIESFKTAHLYLLNHIDTIANTYLYRTNVSTRRLSLNDTKPIANFIVAVIDCLLVHCNRALLFDKDETFHLGQILANLLRSASASDIPAVVDLKLLGFPSFKRNMQTLATHVSTRRMEIRGFAPHRLSHVIEHMRENLQHFLFYYLVGLLSNFFCKNDNGTAMVLKRNTRFDSFREDVIEESQTIEQVHIVTVNDYVSPLLRLPVLSDMIGNTKSRKPPFCLISECDTAKSGLLIEMIIGPRVTAYLTEGTFSIIQESVNKFQKKHRDLCKKITMKRPDGTTQAIRPTTTQINVDKRTLIYFFSKVGNALEKMTCLFVKRNLRGTSLSLANHLSSWNRESASFLTDFDLIASPLEVPLCEMIGAQKETRNCPYISQIQRAVYTNCLAFSVYYMLHWLRLFVYVDVSADSAQSSGFHRLVFVDKNHFDKLIRPLTAIPSVSPGTANAQQTASPSAVGANNSAKAIRKSGIHNVTSINGASATHLPEKCSKSSADELLPKKKRSANSKRQRKGKNRQPSLPAVDASSEHPAASERDQSGGMERSIDKKATLDKRVVGLTAERNTKKKKQLKKRKHSVEAAVDECSESAATKKIRKKRVRGDSVMDVVEVTKPATPKSSAIVVSLSSDDELEVSSRRNFDVMSAAPSYLRRAYASLEKLSESTPAPLCSPSSLPSRPPPVADSSLSTPSAAIPAYLQRAFDSLRDKGIGI